MNVPQDNYVSWPSSYKTNPKLAQRLISNFAQLIPMENFHRIIEDCVNVAAASANVDLRIINNAVGYVRLALRQKTEANMLLYVLPMFRVLAEACGNHHPGNIKAKEREAEENMRQLEIIRKHIVYPWVELLTAKQGEETCEAEYREHGHKFSIEHNAFKSVPWTPVATLACMTLQIKRNRHRDHPEAATWGYSVPGGGYGNANMGYGSYQEAEAAGRQEMMKSILFYLGRVPE